MIRNQQGELSEPSADLDTDQEATEAATEAAAEAAAVDGDPNAGVVESGQLYSPSFTCAADGLLWHWQLSTHNTNARLAAHCEEHSIDP